MRDLPIGGEGDEDEQPELRKKNCLKGFLSRVEPSTF
jgi:hypothetical protein